MKAPENFVARKASDAKARPALPPTVADCMTKKLITFKPDDSLELVMAKLIKYKISGGPVVNDARELVGIISEGDCLKAIAKSKFHNSPDTLRRVKDYMATDPITTTPERDVLSLANEFIDRKIRRFPVLENGKLVGQVSQKDVMKAVLSMPSQTW